MIFFTSDLHLGHENCIRLCNRPFSSIEEMDETLIENWNHKVTGKDTVYILGDLIYRSQKPPEEYLRRLRGRNISSLGIMTGDGSGVVRQNDSLKASITCCMSQTGSGSTHSATTP